MNTRLICSKCGRVYEDALPACPDCGAAPGPARKRRLPHGPAGWALLGGGLLLLAAVVVLALWRPFGGTDDPPDAARMAQVVATCGNQSLTNTELNYYYWSEYFYLVGSYGEYLPDSLDTEKPLDEQQYDETRTWQDYVLEKALDTAGATMSMAFAAEEAGFSMPADYADTLQRTLDNFSAKAKELGYVDEAGEPDVVAYLADSYGPDVTLESFTSYLKMSHLAAAYSDELYGKPTFTAAEISAYYDKYGGEYTDEGIPKDDEKLRSVRTVLLKPKTDDDAGWAEAKASAETLYATWQSESGTEDDFSAMAAAHSADTATSGQGGLRTDLRKSDLTGELADWVFDGARRSGDTAVVRSDDGWVIAYYAGESAQTLWQKTAEADLRQETYQNAEREIRERYPFKADSGKIRIVTPNGLYRTEADASKTNN